LSCKKNLNIIVRGHIRSSFDDNALKSLVDALSSNFQVGLYIQSWNIFQSGLSWRSLEEVKKEVGYETIREYFANSMANIKSIDIIDDSKIVHVGNTEGNIGRTPCPVLAWKNMYYGMLAASSKVVANESPLSITMQMRFDILSNPFRSSEMDIIDFANKQHEFIEKRLDPTERIRFLKMQCFLGVDNIYMAKTEDMHKFISYMYYDMDRILHVHRGTMHQEHIAFHERRSFFDWRCPGFSYPVCGFLGSGKNA
jgi:hypothetical protein